MAETELNSLTINYNKLYPFIYKPRSGVTYNREVTKLEAAIMSARVLDAEKGYYYKIRYVNYKPSDEASSGTSNGWSVSKVKIEDYEAGLPSDIEIASLYDNKHRLDPNGGVQRFAIICKGNISTKIEITIDPVDLPEGVYLNTVSSKAGYQHVIDPLFYNYDITKNEETVNKISSIANFSRRNEMLPIRPKLTCKAFGLLPIDVFGQPHFHNLLYYQGIDNMTTPASITKVMTALIAIESGLPLDTIITIQESDLTVGSGYNVEAGDKFTFETALYNLLLVSSNTTATAIARTVGEYLDGQSGNGYNRFIEEMNKKATNFGMSGATFTNPSGVVQDDHKVTVKSLMILGWRASKNELLNKIWNTMSHTISVTGAEPKEIKLKNSAIKMAESPWYLGGKTGSIIGWGYNIMSYVSLQNGYTGIAVCIKSDSPEDRIKDLNKMVNFVRANYAYPSPAKITPKS